MNDANIVQKHEGLTMFFFPKKIKKISFNCQPHIERTEVFIKMK